jgi:RIMS-binding protein 2
MKNCTANENFSFKGRTHGLTLNGNGEPQVDMLDIPGKGRCCVFMARFSYDPPE